MPWLVSLKSPKSLQAWPSWVGSKWVRSIKGTSRFGWGLGFGFGLGLELGLGLGMDFLKRGGYDSISFPKRDEAFGSVL